MSNFLRNIKIKIKISFISVFLILSMLFVSLYSIAQLNNAISAYYDFLEDSQRSISWLSSAKNYLSLSNTYVRDFVRYANEGNEAGLTKADEDLKISNPELSKNISDYLAFLEEFYSKQYETSIEALETIGIVKDVYNKIEEEFRPYCLQMRSLTNDGSLKESNELINEKIIPLVEDLYEKVDMLYTWEIEYKENVQIETEKNTSNIIFTSLIIIGIIVVFAVIMTVLVITNITKSLNEVVEGSKKIANGEFDIKLETQSHDETGDLARSLISVRDTVAELMEDMEVMAAKQEIDGDFEAFLDENKYCGSYMKVAHDINSMMKSTVECILEAVHSMKNFGEGNFKGTIKNYPGKKHIITKSLVKLHNNLEYVNIDINNLVNFALEGRLSERINPSKYDGDWKTLIDSCNKLMQAIFEPIRVSADSLMKISQGKLDTRIDQVFSGDFDLIKSSFNATMDNISSVISEVNYILGEIASQNLNLEVKKNYTGDFTSTKSSINHIIDQLNDIMSTIMESSVQMASDIKHVSDSGVVLARGSTEQSSSVQELNATIDILNSQTSQTKQHANNASNLSNEAEKFAETGNNEMKLLLKAIKEIEESSSNISQINKDIQDIAFQTNLLALNASIEASHAGVHGAGFAVVADEVRNLAIKSQEAAQKAKDLIEGSNEKTKVGIELANRTANVFKDIFEKVHEVADISSTIAQFSNSQADSINEISKGIGQISTVVQSNAASAEESAATSKELSNKAVIFNELVGKFKLK